MAYFTNPDDEEENAQGMNQQANPAVQPAEAAAPVQLGSQSGSLGGAGKAPAVPKPAASGSGPGFQNYAKANMGIAQGRLNNAAAKNVANQGQVAKSAIGQATTGFGQRVESGSLKDMGNAVADVTNITDAARHVNAAPKPVAPVTPAPVVAAQSAPPPPAPEAPVVAPEAPAPNPFGTLTDEQTNRFSDVINNKYKGPESLRQAGLYQLASGKVGTAQNTLNQTKTATGREDMLKNMYQQRGNYTTGQNKLDSALLNASKQGVQNLQNAATEQGNVERQLDRAQIDSATQAQNRTNDLLKIKNDAMAAFSTGKKDEEKLTEDRLTEMTTKPVLDAAGKPVMKVDGTPMTEWDRLPESFRSIIANKKENNAKMLADETAKVKGTTYDSVAQQHATAKAALAKAKRDNDTSFLYGMSLSGMDGTGGSGITSMGGGKTPEEIAAYQANAKTTYDNALSSYNGLNTQKTGMDSQIAGLTQKYNPNAVNFSQTESDLLGIKSGEGLYNLGAGAVKSGVAENARLVSRDEQARQSVLAQLAGLDKANRLDTNLNYKDADKAGTQSALDALDTEGTRKGLNEAELEFQKNADRKITGTGSKKNKTSGNTYNAKESANLKTLLERSGYKFDGVKSEGIGDADLLRNLSGVSSSNTYGGEPTGVSGGMGATVSGVSDIGNSGTGMAQTAGNLFGSVTGLNAITGALGLGGVGSAVNSLFGGGSTAGESKDDAKKFARADLEKKVKGALSSAGFQNRASIADNKVTQDRSVALQKLLENLDKTNA